MYRGVALRKYQLMKNDAQHDSGGNQNDRDNGTFFHGIIYIYSLSK